MLVVELVATHKWMGVATIDDDGYEHQRIASKKSICMGENNLGPYNIS